MSLFKSGPGSYRTVPAIILILMHLSLLFLGPWLAMNTAFNTTITKELSEITGSDIPGVIFIFSLIACLFLALKNSFSIVNFYIGHSVINLFKNARQTIDYLVMIFSPLLYISCIYVTDKSQLKYEYMDFGLNILVTQHLVSYISYTKAAYSKWRAKDPGLKYGFASILFGIFSVTALVMASAGLYVLYLFMETSLLWRIVFTMSLLAGTYGSLRFFPGHANDLWAARKAMDE